MGATGCPETAKSTNLRRVTSQKSEGLIYTAVEVRNRANDILFLASLYNDNKSSHSNINLFLKQSPLFQKIEFNGPQVTIISSQLYFNFSLPYVTL